MKLFTLLASGSALSLFPFCTPGVSILFPAGAALALPPSSVLPFPGVLPTVLFLHTISGLVYLMILNATYI